MKPRPPAARMPPLWGMTRQTVPGHSWPTRPVVPAAFWRPARCRAARWHFTWKNPFPPLLPCLAQSTRAVATRCLTPASPLPALCRYWILWPLHFLLRTRPTLPQPPRWGTAGKFSGLTICWPHPRTLPCWQPAAVRLWTLTLCISTSQAEAPVCQKASPSATARCWILSRSLPKFSASHKTIFWAIRLPLTLTFRSKTCTRHSTRGLRCRSSLALISVSPQNSWTIWQTMRSPYLSGPSVPCALSPS